MQTFHKKELWKGVMSPNFSFPIKKKKSIISWSPRLPYKTSGKGEDLSRVHFWLFNPSEANGKAEAPPELNLDALNYFLEESLALQ